MATFAVIAEHPPDLCPTSNTQTRQILKEGAGQIPQLAEQLGLNIVTLRIFGPDHIILVVVDADDIDSVRNFALQSRLMQWNTVKIHATYSIEERGGDDRRAGANLLGRPRAPGGLATPNSAPSGGAGAGSRPVARAQGDSDELES